MDTPCLKHVILFVDVMSFNDAMTSYVMSQHCTCVGHMTIYYKKAMNTSVELVRSNSVTRDPCVVGVLTRIGCDASSMSLGGSLLPSTVIIVLTLVNSAASPAGTHNYLNKTQECCSTPC